MLVTSAQANKLLKQLAAEKSVLITNEQQSSEFVAAIQENIEDARPAYDFNETQAKIKVIDAQVREIKHAVNQFNISTVVPEAGMTIDEVLVYIPQLTALKNKFEKMSKVLPKSRRCDYAARSNIIEYQYANYDVEQARAEYTCVDEELTKIQLALDKINTTVTFEISI